MLIVVSTLSPVFARRFPPGTVMVIGLLTHVVGYVLFTRLDAGTGLALVIASFVVTYPGVAPSMALTTISRYDRCLSAGPLACGAR